MPRREGRKLAMVLPHHWSATMSGAEYQARCLLDRLTENEGRTIFYLSRTCDPGFRPGGYEVERIGQGGRFNFNRLYRDTLPLLRLLEKIRPEVIYQRVGCAYTGIAAWYAARNDCRLVWHVSHDSDVQPYRMTRLRWLPETLVEKKYLEYGLRGSDEIIVQTRRQDLYLREHYGREASAVVPNFHPPPVEAIRKEDPVRIVWVGNFLEWKHPEHFVRLARDLERQECAASFYMIGRPSRNRRWQGELEARIAEVGKLEYLGPLSVEEVNSFLAAAHIFVNTSDEEGYANTFIQAWARKVPVVSLHCNFDGVFDRHGVGFHAGSYENLLRHVTRLADDRVLREEMGDEAQRYALAEHSMKNADKVIEFLDS
jgi:glycosyltransferase involved in cell wall biosynthesis